MAAHTDQKKGCSIIVVFMLTTLAFVVGVLAGAGGFYGWLSAQPSVAVDLGLVEPPPAQPVAPAVDAAEEKASKPDYALLYPIEESLRVEGELPSEAVASIVKDRRYELRRCYQAGLEKNPDLKGEMSLQFTVSGENGTVVAALERHTDFASAAVQSCILKEVRSWTFPGKRSGLSVVKFDLLMIPISSSPTEE